VAHPSEVASGKWHIEGHYPTQAKGRLEWDTTALDQWCRSGSLNFSAGDLDFQLIAFVDFNRVCKVHPGLVLVLLYARG
jgi:hypothetical protein